MSHIKDGLIYEKKDNGFSEKPVNRRVNSVKRIAYQRNKLIEGLSEANDNDFIFYSDNDEMPNFANFDFVMPQNGLFTGEFPNTDRIDRGNNHFQIM